MSGERAAEIFVAELEVAGRDRSDQQRLREQAIRWFGSSSVRCLGLQVSEVPGSVPLRYRLRARYVRVPHGRPGRMEQVGEWLGLVRAR